MNKEAVATSEAVAPSTLSQLDGDRTYVYPPCWKVLVKPGAVGLYPNMRHFIIFSIFFLPAMSSLILFVCYKAGEIGWGLLCLPLLFLVIGIFYFFFGREMKKGPWLIYHILEDSFTLPRADLTVNRNRVIGFLEVFGRTRGQDSYICELNFLIHTEEGEVVRYPLVGGFGTKGVHKVAERLSQMTRLPVQTVEGFCRKDQ
jgi:hypothetical protein